MTAAPRRFCTYFDSNYLFKGLALHESLTRHVPGATLTVLCLDEAARDALTRLARPGIETLALAGLEAAEPRLLGVKPGRSRAEYYFTCTPALIHHVLTRVPRGEPLSYLDADLYFFDDPAPLYREDPAASTLVIPHRFPDKLRHLEVHGIYNVGLVSFVHDERGLECLGGWRDRCIEWCFDRVEEGRYADQKYLDEWPGRYPGVHVVRHRGANLAPWNVERDPLSLDGGTVRVGGDPLLFYHFQGLRRLTRAITDSGLGAYHARMTALMRTHIYDPYLRALERVERQVRAACPGFGGGSGSVRIGPLALARRLLSGNLLIGGAGEPR
jgi:hypothetical protein